MPKLRQKHTFWISILNFVGLVLLLSVFSTVQAQENTYTPIQNVGQACFDSFSSKQVYPRSLVQQNFALYPKEQPWTDQSKKVPWSGGFTAQEKQDVWNESTQIYLNQLFYEWITFEDVFGRGARFEEKLAEKLPAGMTKLPNVAKAIQTAKTVFESQASGLRSVTDPEDLQDEIDMVNAMIGGINQVCKTRSSVFADLKKMYADHNAFQTSIAETGLSAKTKSLLYPQGPPANMVTPGGMDGLIRSRMQEERELGAIEASFYRTIISRSKLGYLIDTKTDLQDRVGIFNPLGCVESGDQLRNINSTDLILPSVKQIEKKYRDNTIRLTNYTDTPEGYVKDFIRENPTSVLEALVVNPNQRHAQLVCSYIHEINNAQQVKETFAPVVIIAGVILTATAGPEMSPIVGLGFNIFIAGAVFADLMHSYAMQKHIEAAIIANQIPSLQGQEIIRSLKNERPLSYLNLALAGLGGISSMAKINQMMKIDAEIQALNEKLAAQGGSTLKKFNQSFKTAEKTTTATKTTFIENSNAKTTLSASEVEALKKWFNNSEVSGETVVGKQTTTSAKTTQTTTKQKPVSDDPLDMFYNDPSDGSVLAPPVKPDLGSGSTTTINTTKTKLFTTDASPGIKGAPSNSTVNQVEFSPLLSTKEALPNIKPSKIGDQIDYNKEIQELEKIKRELDPYGRNLKEYEFELCALVHRGIGQAFVLAQSLGLDCSKVMQPSMNRQSTFEDGDPLPTNSNGSNKIRNIGGMLNEDEEKILHNLKNSNLTFEQILQIPVTNDYFFTPNRKWIAVNGITYHLFVNGQTGEGVSDQDLQRMYASYEIDKRLSHHYPSTLLLTIGGKKVLVAESVENEIKFSIQTESFSLDQVSLSELRSKIKTQASDEVAKQSPVDTNSPAYQILTNDMVIDYRFSSDIFLFDLLTGYLSRDLYKNVLLTSDANKSIQVESDFWPIMIDSSTVDEVIFGSGDTFIISVDDLMRKNAAWLKNHLNRYHPGRVINNNPDDVIKRMIKSNSAFIRKLRAWSEPEIQYDLGRYMTARNLEIVIQNRKEMLRIADEFIDEHEQFDSHFQLENFLNATGGIDFQDLSKTLDHYVSLIDTNADLVRAKNDFFKRAANSKDQKYMIRNFLYALDELQRFKNQNSNKIIQQQRYLEQLFKTDSYDIFSPIDMTAYKQNITLTKDLPVATPDEVQETKTMVNNKNISFFEYGVRENYLRFANDTVILHKTLRDITIDALPVMVSYKFSINWSGMRKDVNGELWLPVTDEFGHQDWIFFLNPKYTLDKARNYFSSFLHSSTFIELNEIVDEAAMKIHEHNPGLSIKEYASFLWIHLYIAYDLRNLGDIQKHIEFNREAGNILVNSTDSFEEKVMKLLNPMDDSIAQTLMSELTSNLEKIGFYDVSSNTTLNEELINFISSQSHETQKIIKDPFLQGFYEHQIPIFINALQLDDMVSKKFLEIIRDMKKNNPQKLYYFLKTVSFEMNTANISYLLGRFIKTEGAVIETPAMANDIKDLITIFERSRHFLDTDELINLYTSVNSPSKFNIDEIFSFLEDEKEDFFGVNVESKSPEDFLFHFEILYPYPETYKVNLIDAKKLNDVYLMPALNVESMEMSFFEFDPSSGKISKVYSPKQTYMQAFLEPLLNNSLRTLVTTENTFPSITDIAEFIKNNPDHEMMTSSPIHLYDYGYLEIQSSQIPLEQKQRVTIIIDAQTVPTANPFIRVLPTKSMLEIISHFTDATGIEYVLMRDVSIEENIFNSNN